MKRIEYVCDFCGDIVRKERTGPDTRPFVSFELGLESAYAQAKDRFRCPEPHAAERHICHLCLAGIVALAARTLPADAMRKATDEV